MKALTVKQPWATLVAIGAKRIETRSWATRYRGLIAIHAAKGFPTRAREFALGTARSDLEPVAGQLGVDVLSELVLPRGAIVATAWLVEVVSTDDPDFDPQATGESQYGNYGSGRYAWYFTDVLALPEPVPARGALGLWEWRQS